MELPGGLTRPAGVKVLRHPNRTTVLEIVLTEGRNRQIRRMTAAIGHKCRRLIRVAIGGLELGDLEPGASRMLSPADVARLIQGPGSRSD